MNDQYPEKEKADTNKPPQLSEDIIFECFLESVRKNFGIEIKKEDAKQILEFLEEVKQNQLSNPKSIIKDYYRCAELDYQAAMLLKSKEDLIPLAVFHLQQAVEKLTKAYALHMGLIKEEELYGKRKNKHKTEVVGHISPKSFILLLRKKRGAIKYVETVFLVAAREPRISVEKVCLEFEKLIQEPHKLAGISSNEINSLIRKCEKLQQSIRKINVREIKLRTRRCVDGFISRLKQRGVSLEKIEESCKVSGWLKDNVNLTALQWFPQLYISTIITFPHFSYSRYPGDKITFADYRKGRLGIVDSLDVILGYVNDIMKKLKNLGR